MAVDAVDIFHCYAIVEDVFFLVPKVPETVPLGTDLAVEGPDVVVDDARGLFD